ncbi:MAG: hypothetical protein ABGX83_05000 [Nitrospira sp.]|nr:hypothetical protein [Candidatus Manganitrophaceae bacterium]HIL34844.1 hypothetical protein [Candidatus Manganitrophaceae bacterium]
MKKFITGAIASICFMLLFILLTVTPGFSEEGEGQQRGLERLMMGGTEIQGTVEKPHVVYVVPWKDDVSPSRQEITYERSFREEILEPVDRDRFQRQWGNDPRMLKGDRR